MKKTAIAVLLAAAGLYASPALAITNAPVPTNLYIVVNGNDWAWAGPCAPYAGNSCGPIDLTYQATQGWRVAEAADFGTGPVANDFVVGGTFRCAAEYFNPTQPHCDLGDGQNHAIYNDPLSPFVGNPNVETWVIRTDGLGTPEPTVWAMLVAGFGMVGAALRRRVPKVAPAI